MEAVKNRTTAAHACLVLITLLSGASAKALELDAVNLSENIQKECYLQKNMADEKASMYHLLFDRKNIVQWKKRGNYGFQEFCDRPWEIKWSGSGTWNYGNGEYALNECCRKLGLKVVAFDCDRSMSDYE